MINYCTCTYSSTLAPSMWFAVLRMMMKRALPETLVEDCEFKRLIKVQNASKQKKYVTCLCARVYANKRVRCVNVHMCVWCVHLQCEWECRCNKRVCLYFVLLKVDLLLGFSFLNADTS